MKALLPIVLIAALPASQPAHAKSPLDQIFPNDSSCYLRAYSRAHLVEHPDQRVTRIALGPAPGAGDARAMAVTVVVTLRGSRETYLATAYCENESGHLYCPMEGDAGAFTLAPAQDGAVLLKVARRGMGFEGAQDFVEISGTSGDDRTFLLPAVGGKSCP